MSEELVSAIGGLVGGGLGDPGASGIEAPPTGIRPTEPAPKEVKPEGKPEEKKEGVKKETEKKEPEKKETETKDIAPLIDVDKTGLVAEKFVSKPKASIAEIVPFEAGSSHLGAGSMTLEEWNIVLANCGVFYGWVIDAASNRVVKAPKKAFRLRTNSALLVHELKTDSSTLAPMGTAPTADHKSAPVVVDVSQPAQEYKSGIPNFRVNDSSSIEVTAFETEFEVSLAHNDFSTFSMGQTSSIGALGCSLAVSAGFSHAKSKSIKTTNSSYGKTLVARYLYPRCDIFLFPDDLEPTPELAAAVEVVRKTKSIVALRKLHVDFGQLFCQNLTLGGRLSSTKSISSSSKQTEEQEKEEFKTNFGIGIKLDGTQTIGVPVQGEMEQKIGINTGTSKSKVETQTETKEVILFEATGGDTILANNPIKWAPTVGTPQNWRVINRDEHSSLFETLSLMPGYSEIQGWFVQAMPIMSEYITLDAARQNTIRLKLTKPVNGLPSGSATETAYYLGHDTAKASTPRLVGLKGGATDPWGAVEYSVEIPLFVPQTFKAPVVLSYASGVVGGVQWGAQYNKEYTFSQWSIIGPFSDQLTHGCRVILRTKPWVDPSPPKVVVGGAAATAAVASQRASSMVVFRNQQGAFLPGMSENDEYQYWRILKVGADDEGEHIKEGDEVRLSWAFADQTTGFRDFYGDTFGRRRNHCPPELESAVLFIKMPWPRFETGGTPNTLVMAPYPQLDPQILQIKTQSSPTTGFTYIMEDVSFRIDTVANEGHGDSEDYLMRGLLGEGSKVNYVGAYKESLFGPVKALSSSLLF